MLKKELIAMSLSLFAACAASSQERPDDATPSSRVMALRHAVAGERWIDFKWADDDDEQGVHHDRVAMMIPVRDAVSGKAFRFQLDTGAPRNLLYEKALSGLATSLVFRPSAQEQDKGWLTLDFTGNTPASQETEFSLMRNFDPDKNAAATATTSPVVGTLGLAFLEGAGFAIDYPAQRIYLLSAQMLEAMEGRFPDDFHPYLSSYKTLANKILIPFEAGGQQDLAIFDTGSSMFEMLLPPDAWKKLAHTDFGRASKKMSMPSWGKLIEIYGHNVKFDLLLGHRKLPVSEIYTWPTYDWMPVIGNKLFFDHVIVFDRRKHIHAIF